MTTATPPGRLSPVAATPEPLRLFDPGPAAGGGAAANAGMVASPPRTPRPLSATRTGTEAVQVSDIGEVLRAVAERATMWAEARRLLDEAVDAARAAGHSWRTIGIHAQIPHQTLHQRSRTRGAASSEEA